MEQIIRYKNRIHSYLSKRWPDNPSLGTFFLVLYMFNYPNSVSSRKMITDCLTETCSQKHKGIRTQCSWMLASRPNCPLLMTSTGDNLCLSLEPKLQFCTAFSVHLLNHDIKYTSLYRYPCVTFELLVMWMYSLWKQILTLKP